MEKYFKTKLGKGVDHTRVTIWEDLMIIRGQGFLTEPEKYIASSAAGQEVVSSARMHVAKQHSADNTPYFETAPGPGAPRGFLGGREKGFLAACNGV